MKTTQFIAIDNSCGYTAMAVRDIEAGEEIFTFYSLDYFQDMEGGCPCRSCQPDIYAQQEAEEQGRRLNLQHQDVINETVIEAKQKEQRKKRREKQKAKSRETG